MPDKTDKEKQLERISKRMNDPKHSKGGSSDFWKPESGQPVIIRILPNVGNMDMIWQERGIHYIKDTKTYLTCLSFTTDGAEDCPICEFAITAKDSGDKELHDEYKVRRSYLYNIIIRDKDATNGFIGPKIYTPGVTVFEFFTAIFNDPDYGAFWDVEDGYDLRLEREGTGRETKYQVMPRKDSRPLLGKPGKPDHEAIDELLSKARDHSKILDSLPSYDELVEGAGLSAYFNESEADDEDNFEADDF